MPTDHRAALAGIKTFPSLIKYLRDEMGWPIEQDSFEEDDDLFYDYTAEELGIDAKNSAKIVEIKRLRPLSTKQPWGIFFVKFEPKRLPVVALRRILGQVVLKKRTSAKASERSAWSADDLLFISNYGEGEGRQITFAHFSQPQGKNDLPALKVLGWDNLDTAGHLDLVARELTEHLSWPNDDSNATAWRDQWRSAFTLGHREVITTSKQLSIALAKLAKNIRDRINAALKVETERGPLTKLMNAFRESLLQDLKPDDFADMYAQTIAYGLLSARIADPESKTADDFARHMRTNPFLRELMETFLHVGGRRGKSSDTGIDFDELGVNDVVELLDRANMAAVVADFGDKNPQEDPVIHFYELFLKEYDAKKRMQRGVFYTPRPVVSYIVRSVDALLRTEFGLEEGMADVTTWGEMVERNKNLKIPEGTSPDQPFVQILDPACGTGTFLVEVIDIVHKTMISKWKTAGHRESKIMELWNDYVADLLLPRLHGYELLMAPYAIAHLKVGLKLHETGYCFGSDERARIFLTNALEPPSDVQFRLSAMPALAHEAQAVNEIKRNQRFSVVIGNPPYATFGKLNKVPFILKLLEDYKAGLREKNVMVHDDYIKFIRFAQYNLDLAGAGVFGMITNNSFLDGATHRRMRESLRASYGGIRSINLHGSLKKGETVPGGGKDENVFDITVGVGVSLFTKGSIRSEVMSVDLWGPRSSKYERLSQGDLRFGFIAAPSPEFFFVPKDVSFADEYRAGPSIPEMFNLGASAIKTHHDELLIDYSRRVLEERCRAIASGEDIDSLKERLGIADTAYWNLAAARKHVDREMIATTVRRYLYRPFDFRFVFYQPAIIERARWEVMQHMLHPNLALVCTRQTNPTRFTEILATDALVDKRSLASFTGEARAYPLYTYESPVLRSTGTKADATDCRHPNLADPVLKRIAARLGLSVEPSGLPTGLVAEDIFHYAYAVFHSPGYRNRYAEFLKIDFPRLPLTGSLELFRVLARLGGGLTALHLLESPKLARAITEFVGARNSEVEKVSWSRNTVWIDKGQGVGFRGVPEDVWDCHIGGYQVCEKWLKDRKGRTLSDDDIAHYQKIVVAISETIRLMKEIDEVIEDHGGWPGAFQTGKAEHAAVENAMPFRIVAQPAESDRYVTCVPLVPLKAAAGHFGDPQNVNEEELEWVEINTKHRLRPGMFVAQVVGRSMEPQIPDGAWCLFASPVTGSRQGRTVLVQLRDATDPETGERYTVKRYESRKVEADGLWQHARITLKPLNPDFQPIILSGDDEGLLQVVAELVEVLETPESSTVVAEEAPASATPPLEEPARRTPATQQSFLGPARKEPRHDQQEERVYLEPERDELICIIRQHFGDGTTRERDAAIRELAGALGYERTGTRIRDTIDNALRTALRRGVLANTGEGLSPGPHRIDAYERDFLKEQFLASLEGRVWRERDDAIRDFARWMGFRRTGPVIDELARSLINGLIRESRLESLGTSIRRRG
jgi:SOS-response transcriptional repressor LexA